MDASDEALLREAAESLHGPSMMALGTGALETSRDVRTAGAWFLKAFTLGGVPKGAEALAQLEPELRKLGDSGDAEAAYLLGSLHLNAGRSELAVHWFSVSAAGGNAGGKRGLGFCFERGIGMREPDAAEAMSLYEEAAAGGDMFAQYNVAVKLFEIDEANPEAIDWLRRAAEQGLPPAVLLLADVLVETSAFEEARIWLGVAAKGGSAAAMLTLGELLRDGIGGPVDLVQAGRWFLTPLVRFRNGDGVHEMHAMVGAMTASELRTAGRLAGDESVVIPWLSSPRNQ